MGDSTTSEETHWVSSLESSEEETNEGNTQDLGANWGSLRRFGDGSATSFHAAVCQPSAFLAGDAVCDALDVLQMTIALVPMHATFDMELSHREAS